VVGCRAVANLVYVIVIAKLGEISIPHGLVGYGFLAERLSPVPHAFVVAEEEGVVSNNRSSDGTPECVCAFGSLGDQRQGIHKSGGIEGCILKILKCGSMEYIRARLAGCRNVRSVSILCSAARSLDL